MGQLSDLRTFPYNVCMQTTLTDKKVIAFDLDGTLARSKQSLEPHISKLLCDLLRNKKIIVISGGSYSQYENQFLSSLSCDLITYENLFLMPASGSQLYLYKNGKWEKEPVDDLSPELKTKIKEAFLYALKEVNFDLTASSYGERFQDRGTQFSFSALGENAPLNEKAPWDPDQKKRREIASILLPLLPECTIKIGGTTTIDVTHGGVDKATALEKMSKYLQIDLKDFLFVGDALYEGGNDNVVKRLGIETIQVDNDNGQTTVDTEKVLQQLV